MVTIFTEYFAGGKENSTCAPSCRPWSSHHSHHLVSSPWCPLNLLISPPKSPPTWPQPPSFKPFSNWTFLWVSQVPPKTISLYSCSFLCHYGRQWLILHFSLLARMQTSGTELKTRNSDQSNVIRKRRYFSPPWSASDWSQVCVTSLSRNCLQCCF